MKLTCQRAVCIGAFLAAALVQAAPVEVKVMTRNVYLGADLGPVFTSDPSLPIGPGHPAFEVAGVVARATATNAEARMLRIADEIFAAKPHIIGLQEAMLWQKETPSDFPPPVPPDEPDAATPMFGGSFSQQIIDHLAGLGLTYKPYAVATGSDTELPGLDMLSTPPFFLTDYRLTDHDLILVLDDPADQLEVLGTGTVAAFAAKLELPIAGMPDRDGNGTPDPLVVPRNYGYVDVEMSGHKFRVFNTHLEAVSPLLNELQAAELISVMNASPHPQIVLGDFNTTVEVNHPMLGLIEIETTTYQQMRDALFGDAWADKGTGDGSTWRRDELLDMPGVDFTLQLDYVFHRGGLRTHSVDIIGEDPLCPPAPATGPCWGSDHAGVLATLVFVPEPGSLALLGLGLGLVAWRRRMAA